MSEQGDGGQGRRRLRTAAGEEFWRGPVAWFAALVVVLGGVGAVTDGFGFFGNDDKTVTEAEDRDMDGVPDDRDRCPDTDPDKDANGDGCEDEAQPPPPADSDGDGVPDDQDRCPDAEPKRDANNDGCEDQSPGPVEVGLDELSDTEDVDADTTTTFGNPVKINGRRYSDAAEHQIAGAYPEAEFEITTNQEYTTLRGVAGVQASGYCEAEAYVKDQDGRRVWEESGLTSSDPAKIDDVDISSANSLIFVVKNLSDNDFGEDCLFGWGGITFERRP